MTDESMARLAQSAERKALNLVVVSSSPPVGAYAAVHASDQSLSNALATSVQVRN